jgi:hypothetical protein
MQPASIGEAASTLREAIARSRTKNDHKKPPDCGAACIVDNAGMPSLLC